VLADATSLALEDTPSTRARKGAWGMKLERLTKGARVRGLAVDGAATVKLRAMSAVSLPGGATAAAVLAIDRGAWFSLTPAERATIQSTVTSAGGYISLFRDLTSTSIADARAIAADLTP
jgi:hypothetical protein